MSLSVTQELAQSFIERASTLGLKGKRRDDAALEYFIGAAKALELAFDHRAKSLAATACFIISVRGYAAVESFAKGED